MEAQQSKVEIKGVGGGNGSGRNNQMRPFILVAPLALKNKEGGLSVPPFSAGPTSGKSQPKFEVQCAPYFQTCPL